MTNYSEVFLNVVTSAGAVLGVVGLVILVAGSVVSTYLDLVGADHDLGPGTARREGVAA